MFWYQARAVVERIRVRGHGRRGEPVCVERGTGADRGRGGDTRAGRIAAEQQEKAKDLKPHAPNKAEVVLAKVEEQFITGALHWHPFFESALAGGGFTLGAGYLTHVGSYNTIDVRGSYTFSGYKRIEAEFRAPRLFDRRGTLSVLGGWREATQVGFYGIGTGDTSIDDRANYSFRQPYASATPRRPADAAAAVPGRRRRVLRVGPAFRRRVRAVGRGGLHARDAARPRREDHLPAHAGHRGLRLAHLAPATRAAAATTASPTTTSPTTTTPTASARWTTRRFSTSRSSATPGCCRCTAGSRPPYAGDDEAMPFFMLPALGGGSNLRGFSSWRFRDRHSLLLQAEWRVLVNSFFDTAIFYDAGKVTARRSDLDFNDLKSDYGIGFRLHGPLATPLRIELAKSNEGLALVFSSKAAF